MLYLCTSSELSHMPNRDLERKIQDLAGRLSRISIEQREIALELAEVTQELPKILKRRERRNIN